MSVAVQKGIIFCKGKGVGRGRGEEEGRREGGKEGGGEREKEGRRGGGGVETEVFELQQQSVMCLTRATPLPSAHAVHQELETVIPSMSVFCIASSCVLSCEAV